MIKSPKSVIQIVLLFLLTSVSYAQIFFETHVIDDNTGWPLNIFTADLDKDNDVDIIASEGDSNLVSWYENKGDFNFQKHTISGIDLFVRDVFVADLDNDGDFDVISASENDHTIRWHENHGNQVFSSHVVTDIATGAFRIFVIDLDQDSDLDVLLANNSITWFENNGNQVFKSHIIQSDISIARSVFAIDIDSDNDIDVLSGLDKSWGDSKIVWYENNGSEIFTQNIIANVPVAFDVTALDIDKDNDIDIVSSVLESGIDWYENNGNEEFTAHPISRTLSPENVIVIDFDNDTDFDVISCFFNANKVSWFENNGFFNFEEHVISPDLDTPGAVAAADMDNDGDFDVITAGSFNSKKLELYENLGSPVNHPLSSFSLKNPKDDVNLSSTHANFIWTKATTEKLNFPAELEYSLFLDSNKQFPSPVRFDNIHDTIFTVQNLTPGTTYFWKVLAKNIAGDSLWSSETFGFFVDYDATGIEEIPNNKIQSFKLYANYPNPFNPSTTIGYDLPGHGYVNLSVYNISGRLVQTLVNEKQAAGSHKAVFNANGLSSGVYFYSLRAGQYRETKKMLLVR